MIENIQLRLIRKNETDSETKGGEVKKVVFVLSGFDEQNSVDWTVHLRAEEAMPSSYIEEIGKRIGDSVRVTLGRAAHQTEL